ncbi:MAG: hypothetical protein J5570_04930 [Lachnospiraceae bacterium]|nr:hypothetical protein [Lachnospiraceae bacterium]
MSEKKESAEKKTVTEEKTVRTHYDIKMEQRAKAKQRAKREAWVWRTIGCVIVAAILALILSFPIRRIIAINETVCTIGGRDISRVEFDYNYNMVKNAYVKNYGSYLSYYGMDVNTIENEMYDNTLTFRDYFTKEAVERIKSTVALTAELEKEGYTCDITKDYEEYLEAMKEGAKEAELSLGEYYRESLGQYATQRRVEKYVKESFLIAHFSDDKQASFTPDDAAIDARYAEDADDYDLFDYNLIRVAAELPTEPTELADEGAAVAEDGTYSPSEAEIEAAMKEAKAKADEMEDTVFDDGDVHTGERAASVNYQVRNWLLDPSRKEGDTTVVEAETTSCYYIAGFVARYQDTATSLTARIISTPDATGDAIIAEYNNSGATEDAFIALVDKYSDSGTGNGGLYEGLSGGELPGDLGSWILDASRAQGDVTYYFDETSGETYVIYYVGVGKPSWYYTIRNLIESESMDAYLAGLTATVTVDDPKGNLKYVSLEETAAMLQEVQSALTETE